MHFAALANKVEICQILLENGVKVDRTNSVKRTASQMAAFVGKSNTFNFQLKFSNTIQDFLLFISIWLHHWKILGNHEAVSIINNYVQKEDVYYFTRKQPLEKEAKLKTELAKPIHKLVMSVSIIIFLI